MDLFSCLLDEEVLHSRFSPFIKGTSHISHLLFADDILIVGKASISSTLSLRSVLNKFRSTTGLDVNLSKSRLNFSKAATLMDQFCTTLNIEKSSFPFTYLGLPILDKNLLISHFQPLLERLSSWLAGWKSKFLSFGGRLQLIRYTINNYMSYWFRSLAIPKAILSKLNSLMARFFYHGGDVKKLHLISWKRTTLPRDRGGTGLISANDLYSISKIKVLGKLWNGSSLLSKWCLGNYVSAWCPYPKRVSAHWRELKQVALIFKSFFTFKIGDGNNFFLFFDPWLNGNSLWDLLGSNCLTIFNLPLSAKLGSIIGTGGWEIPDVATGFFDSFHYNILQGERDGIYWQNTPKVSSSIIRNGICSNLPKPDWAHAVWYKGYAINYSIFSWMALIDGLKTSDVISSRGCGGVFCCLLCNMEIDSSQHLFFQCSYSFDLLRALLTLGNHFLLSPSLAQVLHTITSSSLHHTEKRLNYLITSVLVYTIWKERNSRLHGEIALTSALIFKVVKMRVACKISKWQIKQDWLDNVKNLITCWKSIA